MQSGNNFDRDDSKMKRGQIWVETVLYTLIAITLIGVVLSFVMPKITNASDKANIEQTIESMNIFDEKINAVLQAEDNSRPVDLLIKKGEFYINSTSDEIIFAIPGVKEAYSQVNASIKRDRVNVLKKKEQKTQTVYIYLNYTRRLNLSYSSEETNKKFSAAPRAYKFMIRNYGPGANNLNKINIDELS